MVRSLVAHSGILLGQLSLSGLKSERSLPFACLKAPSPGGTFLPGSAGVEEWISGIRWWKNWSLEFLKISPPILALLSLLFVSTLSFLFLV